MTADLCKTCGWQRNCKACVASQEPAITTEVAATQGNASILGEEDSDDDFECDIERYVPFNDKLTLAEKLRVCHQEYPRECLTDIMKRIAECTSSQALEDYGNGRVQLKIDLIERETYFEIMKIFASFEGQRKKIEEKPAIKPQEN